MKYYSIELVFGQMLEYGSLFAYGEITQVMLDSSKSHSFTGIVCKKSYDTIVRWVDRGKYVNAIEIELPNLYVPYTFYTFTQSNKWLLFMHEMKEKDGMNV